MKTLSESIVFGGIPESASILKKYGIVSHGYLSEENNKVVSFESRENYDFMSVRIPFFKDLAKEPELINLYISPKQMILLGDGISTLKLEKQMTEIREAERTYLKGLEIFFAYLLSRDIGLFEEIEDEIEYLEGLATQKRPEDNTLTIISLRKQLSALKRYYEGISDLLEDIEDNRNGILPNDQLRNIVLFKNRSYRISNTVINLRDYLNHVREAYQNQLDLGLNETMQFFTIITAVFLPLTLIVGWYGMNLKMPELTNPITYPIVIFVSLAFIIISLLLCKKKGWF